MATDLPQIEGPRPDRMSQRDVIRALGFDPDEIQTLILTESSVVAIATGYPEPYIAPQEASDDSH